jgi:hypothetical protein
MRNYTGIAVWGCLLSLLAIEFIDFDSPPKARTANSAPTQSAPSAASAPIPEIAGKAIVAKAGPIDKRGREGAHAPFSHIREKRDGSLSFRQ